MVEVVSFGGGDNSTALLCGLYELGQYPDAILFADTGCEMPYTYAHLSVMEGWLLSHGMPPLTIVKRQGQYTDLEEECLWLETLPSKAFGNSGCSVKWKRQVMDAWIKHWPPALAAWECGEKVHRLLGLHAAEAHRGKIPDDARYTYRNPLQEWFWDQAECRRAMQRHGLEPPGKSACFFCPATKKREIMRLAQQYPELYARAIALEENALPNLQTVKGLGRHFRWADVATGVADGAPEPEVQFCLFCND